MRCYRHIYDPVEIQFLVNGFANGFRIPVNKTISPRDCKNHPSALAQTEVVKLKIQEEVAKGRVLGPYMDRPVNLVCSPLAVVPKKDPGTFRLIHDLSFPKTNSVNNLIDKEFSQVLYDSIDTVVQKVKQCGHACLLAKTDIADAFRLVPIHPLDRYLLGFSWIDNNKKQYFIDACLPMGLSMSCQLFTRFSNALQWILETRYCAIMSHIIDDFLFIGHKDTSLCLNSLQAFIKLAQDVGIPIKHEKTSFPTTCLVIYGIEVDSVAMVTRLPDDKVKKIVKVLQMFRLKKKVSLRELQSLLGLLNFATSCVVPGRTFLRRLYDLTIGISYPHYKVRLNKGVRADLSMWLSFMQSFNGKCMFLQDNWSNSETINLFTDAASTLGFAAVFGKEWLAEMWPDHLKDFHINILELFPVVLAIEIWGNKMANHKIMFYSDNMATVNVINNMTSKDPVMMSLVRRLVLSCMQKNILFRSRHVPGKSNLVADHLSRFQLQEAFQCQPNLVQTKTSVPVDLLHI